MRVKIVLAVSLLMGALNLFPAAGVAHACSAELPSTACIVHDVCMVAGPKICRS